MSRNPSKIPFVIAASAHGPLIVNRLDYHTASEHIFGVGIQILEHGAFDVTEVDLTKGLLALRRTYSGDGVVAIDCGANIGVHTIEWAKHMDGWGSVIAIEAQERVYYALAGNVAINNCFNARAVHAVVSSEVGSIVVPALSHQIPASFGSLEIRRRPRTEEIGQSIDYTESTGVETPMVTLDSLAIKRCDLIKIDVEGMELSVLEGAARTIEHHHPIIHAEFIKTDKGKLVEKLSSYGYRTYDAGQNCLAIHQTDPSLSHVEPRSTS
ncbi:FkbM family methyltransferase [Bradyrhizobium sp. CCBAU 51627]|uniref:FkbM family methyltransferase n=1 Tax=Bradyrhizobium sp. CCBAU 51627 TaxID=1325088 RepID=UPI002305E435|nr:FkbM family methyltransferase [Bradyrhizobium sp. CCBAU 51627]MDA9431618.1 FkbM family methyltransferase [Bradyrhizobium sp. CCBAU 51627]